MSATDSPNDALGLHVPMCYFSHMRITRVLAALVLAVLCVLAPSSQLAAAMTCNVWAGPSTYTPPNVITSTGVASCPGYYMHGNYGLAYAQSEYLSVLATVSSSA